MNQNEVLIFAPIAQREIDFYLNLAGEISRLNPSISVEFISFFQPGNKQITDAKYKVYDLYHEIESIQKDPSKKEVSLDSLEKKYQKNLKLLSLHEAVTFNHFDYKKLTNKYRHYLLATDKIILDIKKKYQKISIFQELGGFVAPVSLFLVCQNEKIPHVFFEPSYFGGRIHFNLDTLGAPLSQKEIPTSPLEEVEKYIEEVKTQRRIVVPSKDTQHYKRMGIRKLINWENFLKVYRKFHSKYFDKHKQEYEHIWNHCKRYIDMYFNRLRLKKYLTNDINELPKKFVYFPFHVQLDYSLTIRAPFYLNQLALVNFLCKCLPSSYALVCKEHPITEGSLPWREIKEISEKNSNFFILDPSINTYNIVSNSSAVVTINSKVGYESLTLGKEVLVLGDAFYDDFEIVWKNTNPLELPQLIEKVVSGEKKNTSEEKLLRYFSRVWLSSYDGELYNNSKENILNFSKSLLSHIANFYSATVEEVENQEKTNVENLTY